MTCTTTAVFILCMTSMTCVPCLSDTVATDIPVGYEAVKPTMHTLPSNWFLESLLYAPIFRLGSGAAAPSTSFLPNTLTTTPSTLTSGSLVPFQDNGSDIHSATGPNRSVSLVASSIYIRSSGKMSPPTTTTPISRKNWVLTDSGDSVSKTALRSGNTGGLQVGVNLAGTTSSSWFPTLLDVRKLDEEVSASANSSRLSLAVGWRSATLVGQRQALC